MAIRSFDARKEIHLSVRDLVPADPGDRFGMFAGGLFSRLADGAAIHREIETERLGAAPGYRKEVTVRYERFVDGYRMLVLGRIDGVHDLGAGSLVVEEIKTLSRLDLEREPTRMAAYRSQALIYAFLLD